MVLRHRPHPVHPFGFFRALLAALLLAAACPLFAKWAPVDPAELKTAKPSIDPEAGAEILLKEVEIRHHDFSDMESTYHLRVKIFSARGLDDFAKVEIPYDSDTTIRGIEARTIKPDGTVVELDPKEIFDREIVKTNKTRVKVKSFAPPGLVVGSIVEYRYRESSEDENYFVALSFNSEQPSRLVKFRYNPITGFAVQVYLRWLFSNLPKQNTKQNSDGYYELSMTNVPALKEEPLSPPSYNSASSALIYYSLNKGDAPKDYWPQQRKELAESETAKLAPSGALKTALATIVAPGDDNPTKLHKIYDYCRTKITNRDRDTTSFTSAQQKKLKANKTATDTVTHGYGNSEDVNVLFTALARLAGLDAHFAMCNRRDLMLFNSQITEPFMLPDLVTVVYLDGTPRYFDPGATYLPYGMLAWQNSNTAIMPATARGDAVVFPDGAPANDSVERRRAHFTLDEDGTLEGDVTITYSGYCDAEKKYLLDGWTVAERESYYRDAVKENLKQAEVTQVKIEHVTDPLEPMSVSYHLRVPEYGDRTGSRLFFQPAVFRKNEPPLFQAVTRRADMMMHYSNVSRDEIRFTLPEHFAIEQANSPGGMELGDLGKYEVVLGQNPKNGDIHFNRTLTLNGVYMGVKYYDSVRQAFESIHRMDAHTLALKRIDSAEKPATPTAEAKSAN